MSDLRERVIAAIKAKGPHAKPSTLADAAIALVLEEAARRLDREWPGPAGYIVRALKEVRNG